LLGTNPKNCIRTGKENYLWWRTNVRDGKKPSSLRGAFDLILAPGRGKAQGGGAQMAKKKAKKKR
jgi:hypothetical protein